MTYVQLVVVPCELVEANALVASWHRHHQPVIGHRFSLAAAESSVGKTPTAMAAAADRMDEVMG